MKVLLKADIKGVGKKDQVINAADGYARNYLFPKDLAVPADEANMSNLKVRQNAETARKSKELEDAKKVAEKINGITLNLKVKAGENGKLFGAVTSKEISETLKQEHNIDIDKKKIVLSEPIKNIGGTQVEIKLHEGVSARLSVMIACQ